MIEKFTDVIFTDVSSPITLLFILIVSIYFVAHFIFKNWDKIKAYFEHCYQSRKKKEELYETVASLEKAKDETLSQIKELRLLIEEIKNKQEDIDADRKAQKVNELRKDLIDAYHHFSNKDSNPTMTWNEMEAHAFWSIYNDYTRYGGNDFAHAVIEPAMKKLIVVPITNDRN